MRKHSHGQDRLGRCLLPVARGTAIINTIPVFRATHLVPYLDFCQQHGLPSKASLRRFKLPTDLSQPEAIYLPRHAGVSAIKDIGERQGIFDLPAQVTSIFQLSDFGNAIHDLVKCSPTLFVALQRLSSAVALEDSCLKVEIRRKNNITWLHAWQGIGAQFDCDQWSNITLLLQTVRVFAGSDWQPADVKLASAPREFALAQQYFPESRIFWDPSVSGLSIPTDLLGLGRTEGPIQDTLEIGSPSEFKAGPSFLEAVQGLIAAYLPMGGLSIEQLAEMTELSSRSLQRRFRELGLSYSKLQDQTRFERAAYLLKNSDSKALEIALEVGYSDPSHFTRSFKRMTNLTPREYRRQHGHDEISWKQ